ncbi:MAG: HD domain-containing protein [Alphaproteobacteria bacterium]|nr:HD domain-containing protein [Alphaproteobacteria bacterium]
MLTTAKVKFTRLDRSTKADHDILQPYLAEENKRIADHVLAMLEGLKGSCGPLPVDMYEHGLQTATRALRAGADEETIVCALLHDVGHFVAPLNHGAFAAELLKPYISETNFWILKHHTPFQGYWYFHHMGLDRHARDKFEHEPWYDAAVRFTGEWDQRAFDPDYQSLPLQEFRPMVARIFARPPKT